MDNLMNLRFLCVLILSACAGVNTGLESFSVDEVDGNEDSGLSGDNDEGAADNESSDNGDDADATIDEDGDGYTVEDGDCDDEDANVSPAAEEDCDGIDNDCDGDIDEELMVTFYADVDGDGFGDPLAPQLGCEQPEGHVSDNTDCDDDNFNAHSFDDCDVCGGDNACVDCMGGANGNAVMDNCGECDYDTANDCVQDCNGTWGGQSFIDCAGTCLDGSAMSWIGDGYCDDGSIYAHLNCTQFSDDGGDCDTGGGTPGTCVEGSCASGSIEDCSGDGDCCPQSWIGEGFADCSDQAYGCDLTCCDNDGGDCGGTGGSTCGSCSYDYTYYGSECCDSAWEEFGLSCLMLELYYAWDCSGCACPGDTGGGSYPTTDCMGQSYAGFESWFGDGICDDGTYGIYFNCADFDCDAGDCPSYNCF